MNRVLYFVFTTALVVGGFFVGGRFFSGRSGSSVSKPGGKILYYVDPMNPAHTSPEPGFAPCGMKLEPVYADEASGLPGELSLASLPLASVKLSPEKQQLIGVRVEQVEKKPLVCTKRLLGRVAVDERRVYSINATVDGWITKAMPAATGDYVRSNQVLAAFYSPEFLAAGNALLFALNSQDRARGTTPTISTNDSRIQQFNRNLQQYADSLKNLGMGDPQIHEMVETREFRQNVDIIAPADGFIVSRRVSDGLRFEQRSELYRIADLTRVWILADVFENEAGMLQPGRKVRITCPRIQRAFTATVSEALPRFDTASRTLKVRLEMDNPDYALQPDMFVDVEFTTEIPEAIAVPVDAVVDSGTHKIVYVASEGGYFEPRPVVTGSTFGDQVQITDGLKPGERIVVSGNFLIDSESRMKLAAAGVYGAPAKDPVCGMMVDTKKARAAGLTFEKDGQTYYFCNPKCRERFAEKGTEQLSAMATTPAAGERALDLICGMVVTVKRATDAGRVTEYQGKKYYFCNDGCKEEFGENPGKYVKDDPTAAPVQKAEPMPGMKAEAAHDH